MLVFSIFRRQIYLTTVFTPKKYLMNGKQLKKDERSEPILIFSHIKNYFDAQFCFRKTH